MKVKTSTLKGAALDWAVCTALGLKPEDIYIQKGGSMPASLFRRSRDEDGKLDGSYTTGPNLLFSRKWEAGGPVLTKYRISRTIDHSGLWIAYWTDGYTDGDEGKKWMHCDRDELVAGLRCLVESELGDTVEIPNDLN
jgi:hypothetical protein